MKLDLTKPLHTQIKNRSDIKNAGKELSLCMKAVRDLNKAIDERMGKSWRKNFLRRG